MRTVRGLGALMLASAMVSGAGEPAASATKPTSPKTVRLLAIGNSFSQNATEYLPQIVASQGNVLVFRQTAIGGCPLAKHWALAQKYEANPVDPAGRPYTAHMPGGREGKFSLHEMLVTQAWDVVTLQQFSWSAQDAKSYRPYAGELSAYIRRLAPTAKIWMQETWAYRPDNPMLKKNGTTQAQMYQGIHDAYATIAREIDAAGILPVGTAFQNVRRDPRWQADEQTTVDPKTLVYPAAPPSAHALCTGWSWNRKVRPPTLGFDGKHCTTAGKYLAALIWYESFYGAPQAPLFVPAGLAPEDAAFLQKQAHQAVQEEMQPRGGAGAKPPSAT